MVSTGFRPQRIDGTASGPAIEKDTVAAGHSGEGKGLGFRMEMIDQMLFPQPSGDLFEVFFQFKLVHQLHPYQIRWPYLDRQAAAGSRAVVTESPDVFRPGGGIVDIHLNER
jgi:hypothetical protein